MPNMMNVAASVVTLGLVAACSAQPAQPYKPDQHTLLLCHFDGTARADYARGSALPRGEGELVSAGRFGGALSLGQFSRVSYPGNDGNINCAQGAIEFWLRPHWDGNDGAVRSFFGASGAKHNYINITKLGDKHGALRDKLGVSVCSRPAGAEKDNYVFANADVSHWKRGEWHHIAAAWGGGEARLYFDGKQVAAAKGSRPPDGPLAKVFLARGNCDAVIDEFRISDIPRYFGPFPETKREPKPRTQHFNEKGDLVVPTADGTEIVIPNPYRFAFDLPASRTGYVVAAKEWLSEVDPTTVPNTPKDGAVRLSAFATPGEYEPMSFVIYAQKGMEAVRIAVTDLKRERGTIPAANVDVSWGMRGPRRRRYHFPPKDSVVVTTFLQPLDTLDLAANTFREVFLTVYVPDDARPGTYEGTVRVAPKNLPPSEVHVAFRVLPFRLKAPADKKYGMYYGLRDRLLVPDIAEAELGDMKAHGVEMLHSHLSVQYNMRPSGEPAADYKLMQKGLSVLRGNKFAGIVIVNTGLPSLARLLGHKVGKGATGESLDKDARFQRAAREALEGLKALQGRFPEFEIVLTHMDEVFNAGRLPLYIRLTRAAQQVPGFRHYITFHTINQEADRMRKEIDPYVDIRCHHANYTFDWWLTRGHTLAEYAEELKASGDEGAFYFNPVGAYCDAERYRVFNGLYMWLGPFKYHIPWTYQSVSGDPFNDLDGSMSDHIFGLFSEQAGGIIPAKIWEGYRQGIDDIKYLSTLESLIEEAKNRKPNEAEAARVWLGTLKARIPKPQSLHGDDRSKLGTADEPPFVNAIQQTFASGGLQRMRHEAAQHILRLLEE